MTLKDKIIKQKKIYTVDKAIEFCKKLTKAMNLKQIEESIKKVNKQDDSEQKTIWLKILEERKQEIFNIKWICSDCNKICSCKTYNSMMKFNNILIATKKPQQQRIITECKYYEK